MTVPNINKVLEKLQNANYAGYFDEMDKINIPYHLQPIYSQHKGVFIGGQAPWNFHEHLDTFTKQVFAELKKINEKLDDHFPNPSADYILKADKLLEDGEVSEALKVIIPNTRGTKMHPTVIAINVSYKEYKDDKLIGKNVRGQLQDITARVTELLEELKKH